MKVKIRTPFFETSVKNYIYGDDVLAYAKAADAASEEYDVDVLFVAPYTEIRRVRENTERLIVLAPYMDAIRPGRVSPMCCQSAEGCGRPGGSAQSQ